MAVIRSAARPAGHFVPEVLDDSPILRAALPRFLSLDHPIIPAFEALNLSGGAIEILRRPRVGSALGSVRLSADSAAALFLQAASADLFFEAAGFPLAASDFDGAVVEIWNGAPHLWLARTPRSVRSDATDTPPPAARLTALATKFFARKSAREVVRLERAVEAFLDQSLSGDGRRTPGRWIAEIVAAFPVLREDPWGGVRRRCAGFRPIGLDEREREHMARARAATARLSGRAVRILVPGDNPLVPGDTVRTSFQLEAVSGDPAALRYEAERAAEHDDLWITIDPERWDLVSREIVERIFAGASVDHAEVEPVRGSIAPVDVREAIWIPAPTLSSSIELYSALADVASRRPASVRRSIGRFLGSRAYTEFLVSGHIPESLRESEPEVASRALAGLSPGERKAFGVFLVRPGQEFPAGGTGRASGALLASAVDRLLDGGWLRETAPAVYRIADASSRADLLAGYGDRERQFLYAEWLGKLPDVRLELEFAWRACRPEEIARAAARIGPELAVDDGLIARIVEDLGTGAPLCLVIREAGRRLSNGEARAARDILEPRLSADFSAADREAWLLLGEARRDDGDSAGAMELFQRVARAPAAAGPIRARALRGLASAALSSGDPDEAERCLDEAEACGGSEIDGIETALVRADVLSRRGDYPAEAKIFDALGESVRRLGDLDLEFRFLQREGAHLSDRREHAAAAQRFGEMLEAAGDRTDRRISALLDLGISRHYLGQDDRSEECFREASKLAEAIGHGRLDRLAASNLAELYFVAGRDAEVEPVLTGLSARAAVRGDIVADLFCRSRLARLRLRQGRFIEAARERERARELADRLFDRREKADLAIEESDARLYAGDPVGALLWARRAAELPPDSTSSDVRALERIDDLKKWMADQDPAAALDGEAVAEEFRRDSRAASERVARARAFFGPELERRQPELAARAKAALLEAGRRVFADQIFSASGPGDPASWRAIREELRERRRPLRLRDERGGLVWSTGDLADPVWSRAVTIDGRVCTLDGSGGDPDLVSFLVETLWLAPGDVSVAESTHGSALLRSVGILSADPAMDALGGRLVRVAAQNVTVFIGGESGTGKELLARAVHRLSPRSSRAFMPINVAAFPEHLLEGELFGHARGAYTGADRDRPGLIEAAEGGTLFLDEIGDLPPALQVKLLRVLQEREIRRIGENRSRSVDVRVISATAKSLEKAVEEGSFREDLYYRLKVVTLDLPPLRDRSGDTLLLARHFLSHYSAEFGKGKLRLSPAAIAAIRSFPWPGNVRQLQNAIMEAAALADVDSLLEVAGLPALARRSRPEDLSGDYRSLIDGFRRRVVEGALRRNGGNRTHAARELKLSRQALLYLIRELSIRDSDARVVSRKRGAKPA